MKICATQYKNTNGDSLERVLRHEIQKRKIIETYLTNRKRTYANITKTTKQEMHRVTHLANMRADIALRAILADILLDIETYERALADDMEADPFEKYRQLKKTIADTKNDPLFFQGLYDRNFKPPPQVQKDEVLGDYVLSAYIVFGLYFLIFFVALRY